VHLRCWRNEYGDLFESRSDTAAEQVVDTFMPLSVTKQFNLVLAMSCGTGRYDSSSTRQKMFIQPL